MARPLGQYYRRAFQDYVGGLNDTMAPLVVPANQFVELENAVLADRQLLEKSKGYITDGDPFPNETTAFARMMVNYKRGTTVDKLVVAGYDSDNTNVTYKVDTKETSGDGVYAYIGYTTGTATFTNASAIVAGSGTAWTTHLKAGDKIAPNSTGTYYEILSVDTPTQVTLTIVYATATLTGVAYKARVVWHKDFIPDGITFNNNLVITNGSEAPLSYNNTTIALITDADAPKGKFICAHKGRVFIASTSGAPSSLFWSAANDETAWDATSVEPVFPQDGGNICAIRSFGDSLIVLKDNGKVYQVAGSFDQDSVGEPDFIRRIDLPDNVGVIAGRTATVGEGVLRFLSKTGWYELDQRMVARKISWDIENLVDSISIVPAATQSKTYTFDSKTQWDTGTHSGTRATTGGNLESYFDEYTISDAKKGNGLCAVFTDTSNITHVAYVDSLGYILKYKQYAINGDVTAETIATAAYLVTEISLAVSASGLVGVAWHEGVNPGVTQTVCFSERTGAATWVTKETAFGGYSYTFALKYTTGNVARVAIMAAYDASNNRVEYWGRTGTTWALVGTSGFYAAVTSQMALVLDGSNNPSVSFYNTNGNVILFARSSNAGVSFAAATDSVATTAISTNARNHISIDNSGNLFSMYGDNGTLKKRNHTAGSTATPDATTDKMAGFTMTYVAAVIKYNYLKWSSAGTESIVYEDTTTVANPTTGTANLSYYTGYPGLHCAASTVFSAVLFGANANEILVRRYAPRALYTTAEQSDSTLTAWGNFEVGTETANGNTVSHTIAVATASPASSFNAITTDSLISTDSAKIFVIEKTLILLAAWAKSTIGSIVLNFTGAGIDARQPVGVMFENEYHTAITESGQTNNNLIVVYDKNNAWTQNTPNVSCFCVYKNVLYAGLASRGRILKLYTGYGQAGVAYTLTAVTKEDLLGSLELEKTVHKVYVIYEVKTAGTFDFSYRLNNFTSATPATWNTTTVDQTESGLCEIPVNDKCRSIQFKIEQDELDGQMTIVGFVVLYEYLNVR